MGRKPCCAKEGINRGTWSAREDKILTSYIKVHGEGKWRDLPRKAGLKRCGKSCRLRWLNYLRPDIKRGNFSVDEEELIIRLHKLLGNRWSLIAGRLPGRTDNDIKNYWNSNLRKKVEEEQKIKFINMNKREKMKEKTEMFSQNHPLEEKSNRVFRTKAVRCTKAIMLDPMQPIKYGEDPNDDNTNKLQQEENSMDLLTGMDINDFLLLENNNSNSSLLGFDQSNEGFENMKMVDGGYTWNIPVSTQEEGDDELDTFMDYNARSNQPSHDLDGLDFKSVLDFLGLEED